MAIECTHDECIHHQQDEPFCALDDCVGGPTGRMSATGPNIQNIPIRTPEGALIKKLFISGDKFELRSFT